MRFTASRTTLTGISIVALIALGACGDDDAASDSTGAAADATAGRDTGAPTTQAGSATTTAGGDDPYGPQPTTAPSGTTATSATSGSSAPPSSATASGDAAVGVAETEFGEVLVDGEGMSLYMFMPDDQGPSTCTEGCLGAWPSLTGPATAAEGVDESLLDTAERPDDQTAQVTYNGWPLYYFAQDSAPGDVNGQGSGDAWFLVDASGEPVPLN